MFRPGLCAFARGGREASVRGICSSEIVRGATYRGAHPGMALGIAFGFRQSIEEPKEVLNAGDLQSVMHPLADADESEGTAVFLVSHICTHQRAEAG